MESEKESLGVILMYHRVASTPLDAHGLCISPDHFSAHISTLVNGGFRVVPLRELAAARAGEIGGRAVAITFDDGYLDQLTPAGAILRSFGLPATFFIVGEMLDGPHEFWWDALERLVTTPEALPASLHASWAREPLEMPTANESDRFAALKRLSSEFCHLPAKQRDLALCELFRWSGAEPLAPTRVALMDQWDLKRLARDRGVDIGAHTEHHLWLPSHDEATIREEVFKTKRRLEQLLERDIHAFSYPYGALDDRSRNAARAAGFEVAVTAQPRAVHCDDDPLQLPRFDAAKITPAEFPLWLDAAFSRKTC